MTSAEKKLLASLLALYVAGAVAWAVAFARMMHTVGLLR